MNEERNAAIEAALREVVEYVSAHRLEQVDGLEYKARTVRIGEARLEAWKDALAIVEYPKQ